MKKTTEIQDLTRALVDVEMQQLQKKEYLAVSALQMLVFLINSESPSAAKYAYENAKHYIDVDLKVSVGAWFEKRGFYLDAKTIESN